MYEVTEANVKRILDHHRGGSTIIAEFSQIHLHGFGAFTPTRTYYVCVDDGTSYIMKTAAPTSTDSGNYSPNSLETEHALLKIVASQTNLPIPAIYALDISATRVPFSYLLLAHSTGVPLTLARASGKLSPRQAALLDLRLGSYLKQLHERVQNDWFGFPTQAKDELYSWQEAFTLLFETVLEDAREAGVALPYEDVRRYLSRAIGFFLFDDCEVPSLVSFTGDEDSVLVDFDLISGVPEDREIQVTSFVSVGHALWGDPLLETLFLEPSAAFVEGYGGPLVVFARQKTKRLWYTLFLALVILVQAKRPGLEEGDHEKVKWAKETAEKSVVTLKDAPCY
ncbi:hypothetical protein BD311DRAFT_73367 [Dichomitus squalens]|uniref:Aminoglycoside phosphotransferase domain-containing protein n=1 Tax=Dichomitus squalens TaxID=114155 RepID=A0A4V2JZ30_9APHY|nr:hypothetical protein BD311DRAFT_73367 [Dichomitus squalens]